MIGSVNGGSASATPKGTIITTAPSGSVVTLTKGSTVYTPTEVPRPGLDVSLYTQAVDYGTWTVSATLSGKSASATVVVDATQEYEVELSYLPYTELTAIQSSGTQYINTDIDTTGELSFEMQYSCIATSSSNHTYIGSNTVGDANGSYGIQIESNSVQMHKGGNRVVLESENTNEHTAIYGVPAYYDSVNKGSGLGTTFTQSKKVLVFASSLYNGSSYSAINHSQMLLKILKMKTGTTNLRDYIPVELTESVTDYWGNTQASGAVGLWDKVSDKFFPNNGTGTFTPIE